VLGKLLARLHGKAASSPVQVGLHITNGSVAFAKVFMRAGEKPELLALDYRLFSETDRSEQLLSLFTQYELKDIPVVLSLTQKNYQLMMVDAPDVSEEEVKGVLQWKLRELIDYPIEDAQLSYFDIPAKRASDDAKLGFAVVARNSVITELQMNAINLGYHVIAIDIPELEMRNLVIAGGFGEKPTAVVRLTHRGGSVLYIREGNVYMQRTFDLGLELLLESDLDDSDEVRLIQESLTLEIQRSIDYCSSYLRQPTAAQILMMPLAKNKPKMMEYIQHTLGIECISFDLNHIFESTESMDPEKQNRCLLALGAAIRMAGGVHVATG